MNYWLLAQISFKKAILTHICLTYPDLSIKTTVLLHIAFPFAKIDANQAKIYNKILSTFWDKYQKCNLAQVCLIYPDFRQSNNIFINLQPFTKIMRQYISSLLSTFLKISWKYLKFPWFYEHDLRNKHHVNWLFSLK